MFTRRLNFLVLLGFFLSTPALAVDYDGDGIDDVELIEVTRRKNSNTRGETKWRVRLSKDSRVVIHRFSVPGDAFFHYRAQDGRTYPGIVSVRGAGLPLSWRIKQAGQSELRVSFGAPGDTIPNQRDLDGDGITDLTVVEQGDNLTWRSRFSDSDNEERTTEFGESGNWVGIGVDRKLLTIDSEFNWSGREFNEGTPSFNVQWGRAGDIPLLGLEPGQIGVARITGSLIEFLIRNSDGSSSTFKVRRKGAVPGFGRYTSGGSGFVWFDRSRGRVFLRHPAARKTSSIRFGNSRYHIMLASGQVITSGDLGAYGGGNGGGNGGGDDSAPPTNPGLQSVCPSVREIRSGEIWKAIASTHIPNTDPRRFSTSFITRKGVPAAQFQCIAVYDSNGNQVHSLGQYFPTGSDWSARHYGGSGCGDKKHPTQVVSSAQSNTGSAQVFLKVRSSECIRVPNPNSCYNSSQC
jgi:hypothetical protein